MPDNKTVMTLQRGLEKIKKVINEELLIAAEIRELIPIVDKLLKDLENDKQN